MFLVRRLDRNLDVKVICRVFVQRGVGRFLAHVGVKQVRSVTVTLSAQGSIGIVGAEVADKGIVLGAAVHCSEP